MGNIMKENSISKAYEIPEKANLRFVPRSELENEGYGKYAGFFE